MLMSMAQSVRLVTYIKSGLSLRVIGEVKRDAVLSVNSAIETKEKVKVGLGNK